VSVTQLPPPFWAGPGKVSVKLGTTEVEWTCLTRSARLEPTLEDPTTVDTFCGPQTLASGQTSWVLNLGTNAAFGEGGTEEVLRPLALAGTPIPFKLTAEGYTASGVCLPRDFPWGGDANATWEYDLAWPVQGTPDFEGPAAP
jgi:hypothetical protein